MPDSPELQTKSEKTAQLDKKFSLLASHRRRIILQILSTQDDDWFEVANLAREIVNQVDGDYIIDQDHVLLDLHHKQLPKLADAGIIEYDHQSETVRYQGDEELEALLHDLADT